MDKILVLASLACVLTGALLPGVNPLIWTAAVAFGVGAAVVWLLSE